MSSRTAVILSAAALLVMLAVAPVHAQVNDALQEGVSTATKPHKALEEASPAQLVEVHLEITRGNPLITFRRGLFGERLPIITSASGVDYWVPGSKMAKAIDAGLRAAIFGASFGGKTCPDGNPPAVLYHFPGGHSCAADRPL